MEWFVVTLAVGAVGGLAAKKMKVTAGMLIGAVVSVGFFHVFWGQAVFYPWAKFLTQIISGGVIGSNISRRDVLGLKKMIKPAFFMVASLVVINIFLGTVLYAVSDKIDLMTAMLSCVPGGIAEITMMSADMGADTQTVALFQVVRLTSVLCVFPTAIKWFAGKYGKKQEAEKEPRATEKVEKSERKSFFITVCLAVVGGLLGVWICIPAGAIIFSMVFVSVFQVTRGRAYIPKKAKECAQVGCGCFIGCGITMAYVEQMRHLVAPAFVLVVGLVVCNFGLGILMHRLFHIELATALFSCTPAGVSDMALIAEELSDDCSSIAVLQVVRLSSAIVLFPPWISLFVYFFS